jgi:7-cyano-7-deazaguanine synthase in queuosine biosynthesis
MILLFSGGVDSFIAYHLLSKRHKVDTLYIDCGTPYSHKEISAVKRLVPSTIIETISSIGNRQLDGVNAYVPFRNLYLAMFASYYAEDRMIAMAGLKDDNVSDKTPQAFKLMTDCLNQLDPQLDKPYLIFSPFWSHTKEQIVEWYMKRVGDKKALLDTVSCYVPGIQYCGKCPACFRKWTAFFCNGIYDLPVPNRTLALGYYERAKEKMYVQERNESIIKAVTKAEAMKLWN